ncbi:hypothetical protein JD969_17490 [Planctomycetota bacterium]|nr:hypothetical protein JD969_17490 [Planctomycetota bacterium]
MNRIESIKSQASLATVEKRLSQIAADSNPLSDKDLYALRILGLAHKKSRPNTFTLRLRLPAGHLNATQARAIAQITQNHSDTAISLTARCQLQLRNLHRVDLPAILSNLIDVGLITTSTLMDSVRNIITHPLHNLTEHDLFDITPTLNAFEDLVQTQTHWRNLPRKINLYISATTLPDPIAHCQDIALLPATTSSSNQPLHTPNTLGFTLFIAGRASGQTLRKAQPTNIFVSPQNAPTLLKHLIDLYQSQGPRKKRTLCRICDWLDIFPPDQLKKALQNMCNFDLSIPFTQPQPTASPQLPDNFNLTPQHHPDHYALGLLVPDSKLTPTQLLTLADLTDQYAQSQIRFTPQQNILIPHLHKTHLTSALNHPLLQTLTPNPTPLEKCTLSCTGLPHCSLSLIDTKHHHKQTIEKLTQQLPHRTTNLPVISFSGCKAGCGRHAAADIAIVGRRIQQHNQTIEAADIYIPEKNPASNQRSLVKIFEQIPCDLIADTILPLIESTTPTTNSYLTSQPPTRPQHNGTSQLPTHIQST